MKCNCPIKHYQNVDCELVKALLGVRKGGPSER